MSKTSVKIITGKDNDGNEVKVVVKRPTPKQVTDGQIVASKAFNEAVHSKAIYRAGLMKSLREQGLWGDEQQDRLEDLAKKINAGERQFALGGRTPEGNNFTKKEARELALKMRLWRAEQLALLSETRVNDEYTVEGQSENAKFEFFMTQCVFNEDETLHFSGVEDYRDKSSQEHPYIFEAASELASMVSQFDADYEKKLPENKFLVKYQYAREDGRLINEDGKLVDSEGNLVNEDGRFVDSDGNFVNRDGDKVDEEGNAIEEFVPFDDDDCEEKAKEEHEDSREVATTSE